MTRARHERRRAAWRSQIDAGRVGQRRRCRAVFTTGRSSRTRPSARARPTPTRAPTVLLDPTATEGTAIYRYAFATDGSDPVPQHLDRRRRAEEHPPVPGRAGGREQQRRQGALHRLPRDQQRRQVHGADHRRFGGRGGANFSLLDIGMQTAVNINPTAPAPIRTLAHLNPIDYWKEFRKEGLAAENAWGPNGDRMVSMFQSQLWMTNITVNGHDRDGDAHRVRCFRLAWHHGEYASDPFWSQDGTLFVFTSFATPSIGLYNDDRAQRRHEEGRADRRSPTPTPPAIHDDGTRAFWCRAWRARPTLLSEHQQRQQAGRVQPEHLRDRPGPVPPEQRATDLRQPQLRRLRRQPPRRSGSATRRAAPPAWLDGPTARRTTATRGRGSARTRGGSAARPVLGRVLVAAPVRHAGQHRETGRREAAAVDRGRSGAAPSSSSGSELRPGLAADAEHEPGRSPQGNHVPSGSSSPSSSTADQSSAMLAAHLTSAAGLRVRAGLRAAASTAHPACPAAGGSAGVGRGAACRPAWPGRAGDR